MTSYKFCFVVFVACFCFTTVNASTVWWQGYNGTNCPSGNSNVLWGLELTPSLCSPPLGAPSNYSLQYLWLPVLGDVGIFGVFVNYKGVCASPDVSVSVSLGNCFSGNAPTTSERIIAQTGSLSVFNLNNCGDSQPSTVAIYNGVCRNGVIMNCLLGGLLFSYTQYNDTLCQTAPILSLPSLGINTCILANSNWISATCSLL